MSQRHSFRKRSVSIAPRKLLSPDWENVSAHLSIPGSSRSGDSRRTWPMRTGNSLRVVARSENETEKTRATSGCTATSSLNQRSERKQRVMLHYCRSVCGWETLVRSHIWLLSLSCFPLTLWICW
jgi:hypothetical protein